MSSSNDTAKKAFFSDPSQKPVISRPNHQTIIKVFPLSAPCFILWKLEWNPKGAKWDKVPYQLNGHKCSSTKPWNWTTIDNIRQTLTPEKYLSYDGLGIVFSKKNRIIGIDLDNSIDLDTGKLKSWAAAIVSLIGSYTEISPSKTGVKIFLYGELPEGYRSCKFHYEDGEIEIYNSARYFTVTGWHYPETPLQLVESLDLAAFCQTYCKPKKKPSKPASTGRSSSSSPASDEEILKRARNSIHGSSFAALYDYGDLAGKSHSEADARLCFYLVWAAGRDYDIVDRLFRRSALYREKWERADYRDRTIQGAIEKQSETYDEFCSRMQSERATAAAAFKKLIEQEREHQADEQLLESLQNIGRYHEEYCLAPNRVLRSRIADQKLVRHHIRCSVCKNCLRRKRRLKLEDFQLVIWQFSGDTVYLHKSFDQKTFVADKRRMKRHAQSGNIPAGGFSIRVNGSIYSINTISLPGDKPLSKEEAIAYVQKTLEEAKSRGKGRCMCNYWGCLRIRRPKKSRQYQNLGYLRRSDDSLRCICRQHEGTSELVLYNDCAILDSIRFDFPPTADLAKIAEQMLSRPFSMCTSSLVMQEVDIWGPFGPVADPLSRFDDLINAPFR